MKITIYFIIILLSTFIIDCKSQVNEEVSILNEIFSELPDYIHFYRFGNKKIPIKETVYNSEGQVVGYDTLKFIHDNKIYYGNSSDIRRTDTINTIVGMVDTLFDEFRSNETLELLLNDSTLKAYYEPIRKLINRDKEKSWFDLGKIENTGNLIIRNLDDLPKQALKNKHSLDFPFAGYLYISRLYLNADKSKSIVQCIYVCGGTCGERSLILIERKGNKWNINRKKVMGVF
jgi:hypothetical protein